MVGMFTDVSRIRERLISMVNRTCWRVSSSVCLKASVPYKSFLMQNCYRTGLLYQYGVLFFVVIPGTE